VLFPPGGLFPVGRDLPVGQVDAGVGAAKVRGDEAADGAAGERVENVTGGRCEPGGEGFGEDRVERRQAITDRAEELCAPRVGRVERGDVFPTGTAVQAKVLPCVFTILPFAQVGAEYGEGVDAGGA